MEIGPQVLGKKIFEGFLPYMGRGGHLGYVINIMSSDFDLLYLKAFIQSLVQIGTVISEKI